MKIGLALLLTILQILGSVHGGTWEKGAGALKIRHFGHGPESPLDRVKEVLRMEGLAKWLIQSMIAYRNPKGQVQRSLGFVNDIYQMEASLEAQIGYRPVFSGLQLVS